MIPKHEIDLDPVTKYGSNAYLMPTIMPLKPLKDMEKQYQLLNKISTLTATLEVFVKAGYEINSKLIAQKIIELVRELDKPELKD